MQCVYFVQNVMVVSNCTSSEVNR